VVIPIHDQNPLRRRPYVTWGLIAINVAVFLTEPGVTHIGSAAAQTVGDVCKQLAYFDHHAAIPKELVHNKILAPHRDTVDSVAGPVQCPIVNEHGKSPILSVLESMFLHGGWIHLLGNMLFLMIFGNNVEDRMGRVKFLVFYLACGYVAAYGFSAGNASSTETLIGASGAIAGVLGAYIVMFPRAKVLSVVLFIPLRLPAWLVLGFWFGLQAIYANGAGIADGAGVAYLAHVVGFIFGALIALGFREHLVGHLAREYRDHHSPYAL